MEALKNFLQYFIKKDKKQWIYEALNDEQVFELVIYLNTFDQLYSKGIDSQGDRLGDYSPVTVEIKKSKGQRYDHITLRDTGEFYDSFEVVAVRSGELKIEADGNKEDTDLLVEYGKDVLGLTEQNVQKLIDLVREKLRDVIFSDLQKQIV